MSTEKEISNNTTNDNFIEVPGYGIGVLPEELYKPDLPEGKCPNGNRVKKAREIIRNTGIGAGKSIKEDEKLIPPGAEADAATG